MFSFIFCKIKRSYLVTYNRVFLICFCNHCILPWITCFNSRPDYALFRHCAKLVFQSGGLSRRRPNPQSRAFKTVKSLISTFFSSSQQNYWFTIAHFANFCPKLKCEFCLLIGTNVLQCLKIMRIYIAIDFILLPEKTCKL